MDYALQLLLPILLGLYAGQWLDQKTGMSPLFTLLGLVCGMVLGIGILYKRAILKQQALEKKRQEKKDKES